MTHREKRMATLVGGGLAVLAVWQVVQWTAVGPLKKLREDITAAKHRNNNLELETLRVNKMTRDWGELTARTLHASEADAKRIFRTEILRLAQEHGLTEGLRLGDGVRQQVNNEGFVALPVSIRCTGNKKQILDFLVAFYRLPYLGRITSMQLTAEGEVAPRGRGRENTPPPEPKISVSINASTLVLPTMKELKGQRHGEYATAEQVKRLKREADFARLFARNIFAKWYPKAKEVVSAPPTTQRVRERPGGRDVVVREPVDPRAGTEKLKLAVCESLRGVAYVMVYDERTPDQPPAEYRVDSPVDGGVVVKIEPRGMVVRVQEEKDGASQTVYYFYALGKSFKERSAITPESHPDLAAELNLASAQ